MSNLMENIMKKWKDNELSKEYEAIKLKFDKLVALEKENEILKNSLKGQEVIISVLKEGSENWKQEYDDCRALLVELVTLKNNKERNGKTEEYLHRQPLAWKAAKEFLKKYQHQ